jgi:hypothetical protein
VSDLPDKGSEVPDGGAGVLARFCKESVKSAGTALGAAVRGICPLPTGFPA